MVFIKIICTIICWSFSHEFTGHIAQKIDRECRPRELPPSLYQISWPPMEIPIKACKIIHLVASDHNWCPSILCVCEQSMPLQNLRFGWTSTINQAVNNHKCNNTVGLLNPHFATVCSSTWVALFHTITLTITLQPSVTHYTLSSNDMDNKWTCASRQTTAATIFQISKYFDVQHINSVIKWQPPLQMFRWSRSN